MYLLVDFATDWPESEGELSWTILAKPLSILAIAAAFGLFATLHPQTRSVATGDRLRADSSDADADSTETIK